MQKNLALVVVIMVLLFASLWLVNQASESAARAETEQREVTPKPRLPAPRVRLRLTGHRRPRW